MGVDGRPPHPRTPMAHDTRPIVLLTQAITPCRVMIDKKPYGYLGSDRERISLVCASQVVGADAVWGPASGAICASEPLLIPSPPL